MQNTMNRNEVLEHHTTQSPMTDPGTGADLIKGCPPEPGKIREVVGACQLHLHWINAYGLEMPEERRREADLKSVEEMLERLRQLGFQKITDRRPRENRLIGTCRDYAVLTVALLRFSGIPARTRCGFALYFGKGKYEDHWVAEYWNGSEWLVMDAQLDRLMLETLRITWDPARVPRDLFVMGGDTWLKCRRGEVDPLICGFGEWRGMDYVKSNFLLDIASLFNMPLLPWSYWAGLKEKPFANLKEAELRFLDYVAELSRNPDENYAKLKEAYYSDHGIRVPADLTKVKSYAESADFFSNPG